MWWCNKKNFIYIEVPLYRKCKETLYLICNLVFWLYNCDTKAMRFMNYLQFFIRKKLYLEVLKLERAIQQQRLFIYLHFFFVKNLEKKLNFWKICILKFYRALANLCYSLAISLWYNNKEIFTLFFYIV